jgi:hypothetical protein
MTGGRVLTRASTLSKPAICLSKLDSSLFSVAVTPPQLIKMAAFLQYKFLRQTRQSAARALLPAPEVCF